MRTINNSNLVMNQSSRFMTSSSFIAIITLIVGAFVMQSGWMIKIKAACVSGGAYWCVYSASNPCSAYASCIATGSGYSCTVNGVKYTEVSYEVFPTTPWYRCTTISESGYNCSEALFTCGTTLHYTDSNCENFCKGSWYWQACQGTGINCP